MGTKKGNIKTIRIALKCLFIVLLGSISKEFNLGNDRFDTRFHIFGIESPEFVNFYVDDVLYNQIAPEGVTGPEVFNKPFFILITIALEGTLVGSPYEETIFPQTMLIDYERVYENTNTKTS